MLPKNHNFLFVAVLIDEVSWSNLHLASVDSLDLCISSALGQSENPKLILIRACHSLYVERNDLEKL